MDESFQCAFHTSEVDGSDPATRAEWSGGESILPGPRRQRAVILQLAETSGQKPAGAVRFGGAQRIGREGSCASGIDPCFRGPATHYARYRRRDIANPAERPP